jgi:exopolysaccharide biosynthesis protein
MIGLTDALNLDGGGSSTLWTRSAGVLNHPSDNGRFDHFGQRVVPNIIAIR